MKQPLFDIQDLTINLGTQTIYSQFSARLPDVGITGIIGPNGCGKSTLLRCLGGLKIPDNGSVKLRGADIAQMPSIARARQIAFLPQEPPMLADMTVEGLVAKGRTPWRKAFLPPSGADRDAVTQALEATQLSELRRRPLTALSGGQRQRAWIAMALAQQTDVILLDEPTSYLDLPHQIRLMQLLRHLVDQKEQARRVVVVLHDLTIAARFCDTLVGLSEGKLVCAGAPAEALTPQTVMQLYGLRAQVRPDPVFARPVVYPEE